MLYTIYVCNMNEQVRNEQSGALQNSDNDYHNRKP